jgi:hypothetical protein
VAQRHSLVIRAAFSHSPGNKTHVCDYTHSNI